MWKRELHAGPPAIATPIAMEREINSEVSLCDANGKLNPLAVGWARHPYWQCNVSGRPLRKKKWDYWCFVGPERLCSLCIAHVDYVGLVGAYLLDYAKADLAECGMVRPFAREPEMPPNTMGTSRARFGTTRMEQHFDRQGGTILFEAPRCKGRPLHAEFRVFLPADQETLNVVVPWSTDNFQFTSKQLPLACEGEVRWGDAVWTFDKESTFGVRDFGRGIWPYQTTWNWAALSGKHGNNTYGINLGGQWTDNTGATENGLMINGHFFPIPQTVQFEYDTHNYMRPWRIYTPGQDIVDLELLPFFDKHSHLNLGLLRTTVHQCFGNFRGTVRTAGETVAVNNALGWAEEQRARW